MDNLVLMRVAPALDLALRGTLLVALQEEAAARFRLVFESADERRSALIVSLDPVLPWVGSPCGPRWRPRRVAGPFASQAGRALSGSRVRGLRKPGPDRVISIDFADGQALIAELATHGANLIHLDPAGAVVSAARHPRSAQARIVPGQPYEFPPLPAGKLVPHECDPGRIDLFLERAVAEGEEPFEVLRRRVFGLGTAGAALVMEESTSTGRSVGEVLAARLRELDGGLVDPVVEGPGDPLEEAAEGRFEASRYRLLPWEPAVHGAGALFLRKADAAGTAGLFHEAVERARVLAARTEALRGILRAEAGRLWEIETKIAEDIEKMGDPGLYRTWGEAILAGLRAARRVGGEVFVPDPYDIEGKEISVPAEEGVSLTAVAEAHFERSRKARRGIEAARRRGEAIASRRQRLEALEPAAEAARSEADAERLEDALRQEGVPVGLRPPTRVAREAARVVRPRLEGVRMFVSSDGLSILVGKTGRENNRLTFRLAGPEDFWFHAAGVPGAHVVVRNPGRLSRPPEASLREAASLAAFYSDARDRARAEVHWTRRKNVRRQRGAAPGTVVLKRFESLLVHPSLPPSSADPSRPC